MWVVLYRRDIEIDILPKNFTQKEIDEFLMFNEVSGEVAFNIGNESYTYNLPRP